MCGVSWKNFPIIQHDHLLLFLTPCENDGQNIKCLEHMYRKQPLPFNSHRNSLSLSLSLSLSVLTAIFQVNLG